MFPEYITDFKLSTFIEQALAEDVGNGDHTSLASIPAGQSGVAILFFKEDGIVAGLELAGKILHQVDATLQVEFYKKDGDAVFNGEQGLKVSGNQHSILVAERLVLNCMQRMSGIATQTKQYLDQIKHTKAHLLDTRKTTPNFRMLEKWAVKIGGGQNHRFGLYDMILIKDNHVDYAGGIRNVILSTINYLETNRLSLKIEIETRSLREVEEVLAVHQGQIERILLDNMPNDMLKAAVLLINGRIKTEASGNVDLKTIKAIAETGVDYISVGKLTHTYRSVDISLKAVKQ